MMNSKKRKPPETIDEYLAPLSGGEAGRPSEASKGHQGRGARGPGVHQLRDPGLPSGWKAAGRLWRGREPLRLLPRRLPGGSAQGRPRDLRHQQGHHPLSSGETLAGRPGAEAGEGPDRGANRPTTLNGKPWLPQQTTPESLHGLPCIERTRRGRAGGSSAVKAVLSSRNRVEVMHGVVKHTDRSGIRFVQARS